MSQGTNVMERSQHSSQRPSSQSSAIADIKKDFADVKSDVSHLSHDVGEAAMDAGRRVADTVKSGHERVREYVTEHPTTSVLIAAGVGAILARLLWRP